MLPFEIITNSLPRDVPGYSRMRERHVNLPRPAPDAFIKVAPPEMAEEWWMSNWWCNFAVDTDDKPRAVEMAKELYRLMQVPDLEGAIHLVEKLKELRCPMAHERTHKQDWDYMLLQTPGDIGGGRYKSALRDILGNRYRGKILEAMCGFNSFFEPSPDREVVATDYSRAGLELYDYPERIRVLFDLNDIQLPEHRLPFAKDDEYDVVSICFGYKYLNDPLKVLHAFRRALKPGGRIVFVEQPGAGYQNLVLREFDEFQCVRLLMLAGFSQAEINPDEDFQKFARWLGHDGIYMVEGS